MGIPNILVVDDERLIRWSLQSELQRAGYQVDVAENGKNALATLSKNPPDLVLLDIELPDINGLDILQQICTTYPEILVIMITCHKVVEFAVKSLKAGAYDYVCKPFQFDELLIVIKKACEVLKLRRGLHSICASQAKKFSFANIIGRSAKMQEIIAILKKMSFSVDTTVLLQGESGTGKDLLAKTIHYTGKRKLGPFIEINCAAIPDSLLESELLGFEKGAFTDAKKRKLGLFEMADGGTLYLDEIGDMPYAMQAKLLKFIEDKTCRRLGGLKDISVNVRLIAATNQDLKLAIEEKRFRQDLYYRLNVMRIKLPPLRERNDITILTDYFFHNLSRKMKKKKCKISPSVYKIFQKYPWPGNIREMQNVLERGIILMEGTELLLTHLPVELRAVNLASVQQLREIDIFPGGFELEKYLLNTEREIICKALREFDGNQVRTANYLGITRDALRYRLKKTGIS